MVLARTPAATFALLATVSVLTLGAAGETSADSIAVAWDPSASSVGYKVHVGAQPGTYTQHFDVGSATDFTFTSAVAGQPYCFAVSAYDLSSLVESPNSAEVCGYSNAWPTLVNPGNRSSTAGQAVTLQLVGSDPESQPLTYSATGLPPGLTLMTNTGFISGAGTTANSYNVTVRAFDGVLTASQVFTWVMSAPATDTTRPAVSISTPTTATSYSTTSSSINVSGTAADNVGVTQVRWATDRGHSGLASGTTGWSVAVPLLSGTNVITVTAYDAAGNQGTDSLTVAYATADTTQPTPTISAPTTGTTYAATASTIALSGTAADNVGVAQVRWRSDRGGSGVASGTTNWNASAIPLLGGTNVITITAVDAAGNEGADTLTVTYAVTTPTVPTTVALTAQPKSNRRWRSTRLSWSNAPWSSVDVYRNGMLITNTPNDGTHTDPIFGGGTYTYRICSVGSTTVCSNIATVFY